MTRRRRIGRVVFCALCGVVLVYALTWTMQIVIRGGASSPGRSVTMGRLVFSTDARWPIPVPADWPAPSVASHGRAFGRAWESANTFSVTNVRSDDGRATGNNRPLYAASREVWGWPAPALETRDRGVLMNPSGATWAPAPGTGGTLSPAIDAGIGVPGTFVRLPLRPTWPGFFIDAALYGGAVWILLVTPGVVVRWRRKRRGRCPACGYELAGLDTCPECGRAKAGRPNERPASEGQSRL